MFAERRTRFTLLGAAFLGVVCMLSLAGVLPLWIAALYSMMSLVLFLAYAADKSAAQRGRWRTSETALHLLALAGGWPGAMAAQQLFRHKTQKQPFQRVFWATVLANVGLLVLVVVGWG